MTNLSKQRRMAADLLKCGVNRVYISDNTEIQSEIAKAISREEIRRLVNKGLVSNKPKRRAVDKRPLKGQSRGRVRKMEAQKKKGRRVGPGSRQGKKYARYPKKERWINIIRPIRAYLKNLRDTGVINKTIYRRYYLLSKGGMFRSKAHLKSHLIMDGHLKEE